MEYPDQLPLKYLESEHAEYAALKDLYVQLDHLTQGGHLLETNKERYLPKRPGETDDIYQARLNKFTYTNILGSALTQQTTKLSSGSYSISGLEQNSEFWDRFREDVDLCKSSELKLLQNLFRESLIYQKVFVHVDKPRLPVQPRNRKEEEALGVRPYLTLYHAAEVIDWVEDRSSLQMIKVKQFTKFRESLLSPAIDKVVYTIITPELILRYAALVKVVKGRITAILKPDGEELTLVDEDTQIPLDAAVTHNFGSIPVLKFELPDELWACNAVYLKAREHLVLDNTRFDAASMAYVQRILTPQISPESDLSSTYVEEETILSGNPFILRAADFQFAEMKGDVLNVLTSLLADLESQVKDTLALGGMSADKVAVEQSGVSKKMDFALQEAVLRAYGALLLAFYQDVLQAVSQAAGFSNESISASGFASFDLDSADDLLLKAIELLKLEAFLTPTAFRLFCKQLNNALVPNASATELAEIHQQVESLSMPTGQGIKPDNPLPGQTQTPNLQQD
jgi:hypothetical protein